MSLQRQVLALDNLWFDDFWTAIGRLAPDQRLLVLGGRGSRQSMLALSWDEVPWPDFLQQSASVVPRASGEGWTTGHLAIGCYDENEVESQLHSRAFRVKRSLIIDHRDRRAEICQDYDWASCRQQVLFPPTRAQIHSVWERLPQWRSTWTDAMYQDTVRGALEEIRRGRYYQINLLRYWFSDDPISRRQWLAQLTKMGGPFSAYIEIPDLQMVSFSPERFFRVTTDAKGSWIETEPIKGTRPVSTDPELDRQQKAALLASEKDAAELNMIVDLLRNDLHKVCRPSSVKVLDPGSLQSFSNVHHRVARIQGLLQNGVSMGSLMRALCPGGSITGAPKHEVMQAIREKELRPRELFMGNILYKDAWTGRLDSSILIRTAVRKHRWEFAAGSGLVIHSEPAEELAEILTKARVLLGEFV
ncbi:MAG TPA: anthranilate synthase component I family protein [Oligoflexus sp.]|uniref:anthranilate synthase component I family protein n=1 Tax=Oligoflexus sp. TaxID=1971216 RepID=UPI002D50FAC7|nr:anthranilate synthase component I family protein [Oligoflexus sp.]HYX36540.1 anthranilate synthase component I family protein [Oligoflexus sp.]